MEQNALAQVEGPLGQVFIGFVGFSQNGFNSGATDFVTEQGLGHLFASAQGLAVGLVRAVERDRLGVLHPDECVGAVGFTTEKVSLPSGLACGLPSRPALYATAEPP